ncbi:MAG: nucleotidyltransferase family protein [Desulfotignum sp.]
MTPDRAAPRHKKVAGIILAAGCGSRMGRAKQLLPFGDTTLLGRVIATAGAAGLDAVFVVLGFEAGQIRRMLHRTSSGRTGIQFVDNPDWHKGQSSSVSAGLKDLPPDMNGALFLLGDQPLVTVQTINQLVFAFQTTDHWILAPRFKGQRGNPVLVASPLFDRLTQPAGDAGARILFEEFRHRMHCLDVDDPGILKDVDTPEDYDALVREQKRG